MAESLAHVQAACRLQKKIFDEIPLPVIPLFETPESLDGACEIVAAMLKDTAYAEAARVQWDGMVELMIGYSDSAKLAGVLSSRLAISRALPSLEKLCLDAGLTPVFFHGSGGSVDRGGGSIEDQTSWWPRSALRRYKVTIQGEMVERSFASAEIAKGQIDRIVQSAGQVLEHTKVVADSPSLNVFAERVHAAYSKQLRDPEFLELVERATPYSYLEVLRIGSRPVKRSSQLTVAGLRAIPWVLCWTQIRLLFPTWWGVGTAWRQTEEKDREALRQAFRDHPVFTSYMKALGFTLAKIEWPIWRLAMESSGLPAELLTRNSAAFRLELEETRRFFREVTGHDDCLWFRPWLSESIRLRSPMIHPLNVLQLLANRDRDDQLLRLTVTGISSGMLTTG